MIISWCFNNLIFRSLFDKKGLISFMKSSIKSIKISTRSVSTEIQKVKDHQNANEERLDDLEKAMQHVSDKVEEWVEEKAVLLGQINDLRARYDLKCDEIEQYNCRLCLVLWGVEEKSNENIDQLVLHTFKEKLNIDVNLSDISRCHRYYIRKVTEEDQREPRPIIIRFVSYRVRDMVFRAKRKLKNTGYTLFENLTSRRAMIMKEAKKIAGFNKVWSRDGNILTFDQSGKIFNVKTLDDLRFVKANVNNNSDEDA